LHKSSEKLIISLPDTCPIIIKIIQSQVRRKEAKAGGNNPLPPGRAVPVQSFKPPIDIIVDNNKSKYQNGKISTKTFFSIYLFEEDQEIK
jgi:hypothetical protein